MKEQELEVYKDSLELARDVQPLLEKQAECVHKAELTIDTLITQGVVPFEKRAELITKLEDPTKVYDLLVKIASQIGPESLAEPAQPDSSAGQTPEETLKNWILS